MYDIKSIFKNITNQVVINGLINGKRYFTLKRNPEILVINGFWRSGTTFFQELLQQAFHTEFLFEPLNGVVPKSKELILFKKPDTSVENRKTSMLSLNFDDCLEKEWLKSAITHFNYHSWVKSLYKVENIGTYNNDRLVIKFVNAHFFLNQFNDRNIKTIHIERDLIQTMNSFKKTKWTTFFKSLNLYDALPVIFFKKYPDRFNCLINYVHNQENYLLKVALYKLLTDFWVKTSSKQTIFYNYHQITNDAEHVLSDISNQLNWKIKQKNYIYLLNFGFVVM